MQQLDLFDRNNEFFFLTELEKVKNSVERQRKAMFAILTEMQDEILRMKEKGK